MAIVEDELHAPDGPCRRAFETAHQLDAADLCEVDLLIETDQTLVAIECKRTERPNAQDARGIRKLREFYGPESVRAAYIACATEEPHQVESGVVARSGWTAWDPTDGQQ